MNYILEGFIHINMLLVQLQGYGSHLEVTYYHIKNMISSSCQDGGNTSNKELAKAITPLSNSIKSIQDNSLMLKDKVTQLVTLSSFRAAGETSASQLHQSLYT